MNSSTARSGCFLTRLAGVETRVRTGRKEHQRERRASTRIIGCAALAVAVGFGVGACKRGEPSPIAPATDPAPAKSATSGDTVNDPAAPAAKPAEATPAAQADGTSADDSSATTVVVSPAATSGETTPNAESAVPYPKTNELVLALSAECREAFITARSLSSGVPRFFRDMQRKPDEIDRDMIDCIAVCERFLKDCGGGELDTEIKGILSRMVLGRFARVQHAKRREFENDRERLAAWSEEYLNSAKKFAEESSATKLDKREVRAEALRLLVQITERQRDFDSLRKYAAMLEKEFPKFDLLGDVIYSHGRSFISQGRYQEAYDFAKRVTKERDADDELAIYNIVLYQGMLGTARLEEIEELMEGILVEYPLRAESVRRNYLRVQYAQWYNVAHFWIGYCRFARGDIDGARESFEAHVAQVESLKAKLDAEGKKLDQVVAITLDYRTRDLLLHLDDYHGKVPTLDLDFGSYWATEEKLSLANSRGKVVILMFRTPGDLRSLTFAQEAGRLAAENPDKVAGALVTYVVGKPNPGRDAEKLRNLRDEAKAQGIGLPAGIDPDRERQSFFKEVHATIGPSASCIVLDRQGAIAFYVADPRDMDRMILRRAVERLMKK